MQCRNVLCEATRSVECPYVEDAVFDSILKRTTEEIPPYDFDLHDTLGIK